MLRMHCEGCLADLEFSSSHNVPALAARDELAALDYWQTTHAQCRESMQRLRESQGLASLEAQQAPAAAAPTNVVTRPEAITGPQTVPQPPKEIPPQ